MCTPTKHLQMPLVTVCSCLMWQCLQLSCWCNDTLIVGKQPSSMTTHRFYSFPVTSSVHFVHNSCPSISQRKLQNCPWDDSTTPKPQQENKRWEGISWDVTCPSLPSNQVLLFSGQFGRRRFQDYMGWHFSLANTEKWLVNAWQVNVSHPQYTPPPSHDPPDRFPTQWPKEGVRHCKLWIQQVIFMVAITCDHQ